MTSSTMLALLVTLTAACATRDARIYVGTTEDDRVVDIQIDGDFLTAEIEGERFAGELSLSADPHARDAFEIPSESGSLIEGIVVELIVGSIKSSCGELVLFSATEVTGYGQTTQADYTIYNGAASYCVCNSTYHRVYCRRTDGSWAWSGSYC